MLIFYDGARGAKTAMTLCLRCPNLVGALISVENAPVDAALESKFGEYVMGMKAVEARQITKSSEVDSVMQSYEASSSIRQFLLANLVRSDPSIPSSPFKFRIPLKILGESLGHMADFPFTNPGDTINHTGGVNDGARYDGLALFVRGTRSRYVPDELLPIVGRFFPKFRLVDIQDAGHWVISEKPEDFRRGKPVFVARLGCL